MVLKPLVDAVKDGNMICSVIRSSGSNQDGKSPGIAHPSVESQEKLIRHVYQKAKLDLSSTRYLEAHGACLVSNFFIYLSADANLSFQGPEPLLGILSRCKQ